MGRRSAVAACLVFSGFLWIPVFGTDRSLVILLILDGGVALLALAAFQLPALSGEAILSQPPPPAEGDGNAAASTR